jgi:hypothetical protein
MREDSLQRFRENVLLVRTDPDRTNNAARTTTRTTLPQDVTFHSTEEMLLRSRQRVQQELMLSRMRAADALGPQERYLEQKMMASQAKSTKRYSDLHELYSEAVHLRDRYKLSVQIERPVMTTQEEYKQAKQDLKVSPVEPKHDFETFSDRDLEKYRAWLRAKSDFTGTGIEGPLIY